jgi:hypothetical protein
MPTWAVQAIEVRSQVGATCAGQLAALRLPISRDMTVFAFSRGKCRIRKESVLALAWI